MYCVLAYTTRESPDETEGPEPSPRDYFFWELGNHCYFLVFEFACVQKLSTFLRE